jgi:hypothetical protein
LAGLSVVQVAVPDTASAFQHGDHDRGWDNDLPNPSQTLGRPGDVVLPWLDQPGPNPFPGAIGNFLVWEELDTWLTPADNFHFVTHFGIPSGLDEARGGSA